MFSAILTAFNVESYKLIRPPDDTAIALQRISVQLQSFKISPPFVNATVANSSLSDVASIFLGTPSPTVLEYAVKLNTLWFSALILSLASTVIGILAKQWIGEYSNGLTGTSFKAALRRQYRLNNLVKWRVGHIIALIPILLLISLSLFLAGILVLVWQLHPTVARVVSVLIAVVVGSTTAVTLLPLCMTDCAYISPQTRPLLFLWPYAINVLRVVLSPVTLPLWNLITILRRLIISGGGQNETRVEKWLRGQFPSTSIDPSTWLGHERAVVNLFSDTLRIDMLIQWYDSTLNDKAVSSAAICLLTQGSEFVLDYFGRLDQAVTRHFNAKDSPGVGLSSSLLVWQVLLCAMDAGSMGLLQKRRLSQLLQVSNYLPTDSKDVNNVRIMLTAIQKAAADNGHTPGPRPYPMKQALLRAKEYIHSLRHTESTEDGIGPSRGK